MNNDLQGWYQAREEIVSFVRDEILGPEDEVLDSAPLSRIISGVLYPQEDNSSTDFGSNESAGDTTPVAEINVPGSDIDDDLDHDVALSNQTRPSSIGLTFALDSSVLQQSVFVHVAATRYIPDQDEKNWAPEVVQTSSPIHLTIPVALEKPTLLRHFVEGSDDRLQLVALVRPPFGGRVRVTVSLVNLYRSSEFKGKKDAYSWFRPELRIQSSASPFVENKGDSSILSEDADLAAAAFLYRSQTQIAQGHGCSPEWDPSGTGVWEIRSTFMPSQCVPLSSALAGSAGDPYGVYDLNMGLIAEDTSRSQLIKLADAYEAWILKQRQNLVGEEGLGDVLLKQGLDNLEKARVCLHRIREGIECLENPQVAEAFKLMNLAMIQQRDAQDLSRSGEASSPRETIDASYRTKQSWRPFQMAFILMNLPGLADRSHPDRELADLLWFPTGGGKTEAYLGCIAFSILHRRIVDPTDGGVSALMRYTLRILTTDQFTRAAGLVCALEVIRRRHLPKSSVEISLGLWVGDQSVPNRRRDALKELNRLRTGNKEERDSNLLQVKRCPHCGSSLSSDDYKVDLESGLRISCPVLRCDFNDGLPLYIIDEDVYVQRPSLVVGTVDKFAQMAWKSEVAQLLGTDGKFSTPDLIVQDELHLISGPLGTMVGLYESSLDLALTDRSKSKVKIIASTATIRQADDQVSSVFDRKSAQFPPAGITPSDNYFSKEASPEEMGDRRYVGLIAPGTSQATLIVRLYAALLQAGSSIETTDEIRDAYWTLLGYFNSLRVLGSTYLQVIDDIPDRISVIASRRNQEPRVSTHHEPLELTSRRTAAEILSMREQLETSLTGPNPDNCPNIVLATNMISVGLDIDRLGLMVVAGQPQNTSEYIQATSRVGRRHPGLVFVAFNAQRSRDVSHFESFVPFHRSLYRAVEATTATPFAARARDRGAHGVLVAGARMAMDEMRAQNAAGEAFAFRKEIYDRVIRPLVERASRVSDPDSGPFEARLIKLLEEWSEASREDSVNTYGAMSKFAHKSTDLPLLQPSGDDTTPGRFNHLDIPWETLTSLRDVDAETHLSVYVPKRKS